MTTTIRSSADGSKSYIAVGGTDRVTIGSQGIEAGSYKPGSITANDFANGALIENSVNGIGYGVGAGGTVTQATSKSTAVTLNKPCGLINTADTSLSHNAVAIFAVNCSLVSPYDSVEITPVGPNTGVAYNYQYGKITVNNGVFHISIRNISGGTLAESIAIVFSVIKGATS